MRNHAFRSALSAAGLLVLSSASMGAPNAIRWAKSFDDALAEAKRANKLVMADFYTDW